MKYGIQPIENSLNPFFFSQLAKSQNPNRVNAMCTVIIKLTETIKALKDYEFASV